MYLIMNICTIVTSIFAILGVLSFIGYISMKMGITSARTLEGSIEELLKDASYLISYTIKKFWKNVKKFFQNDTVKDVAEDWLNELHIQTTGRELPNKVIRSHLILINEEWKDLLDCFSNLYEYPVFTTSETSRDILICRINAVGLVPKYRDITNVQIAKIARHIIKKFFYDLRDQDVDVFILISTPQQLYFKIPLSIEAGNRISREISKTEAPPDQSYDRELEEEIDDEDDEEFDIF